MYLSGLAYVVKVRCWEARIGILENWLLSIRILVRLDAMLEFRIIMYL